MNRSDQIMHEWSKNNTVFPETNKLDMRDLQLSLARPFHLCRAVEQKRNVTAT
jgi:hypothetical protein